MNRIAKYSTACTAAFLITACALPLKKVSIISTPNEASIRVNGHHVGATPVDHEFDFSDKKRAYVIEGTKAGFADSVITITGSSEGVRSGVVSITLEEDPVWKATRSNEATNRWLRIAIDTSIDYQSAWQKIVDSVTGYYNTLEQLDYSSGYIRSTTRVHKFPLSENRYLSVRTQFLGTLSSREPLTYKLKLISAARENEDADWHDYDRVFKEDAQLVEELQSRLGLK